MAENTFYKYDKRGLDNQINWASIGQDMSNMLAGQMKAREDKKKEIDEASNEYVKMLNDVPSGQFASGNEALLKYAGNQMQWHLMQDRLLKSGQLDPNRYTINRQNSEDDTRIMFEVGKKFQEEYARRLERYEKEESGDAELKAMMIGESFSKWKDVEFVTNPETGALSVVTLGPPDENGIRKPKDPMTIQQFGQLIGHDYDRYNIKEYLDDAEDTVGEFTTLVTHLTGKARGLEWIESVKDKSMRDDPVGRAWNLHIDDIVNKILVNPNDGASVLTDTIGSYESVFNESEAKTKSGKRDPKKVLFVSDGYGKYTAELTKGQKAELKEYVDRQMVARVDKEHKATNASRVPQARSATDSDYKRADRRSRNTNAVGNAAQLYFGNDLEVQESIDFFRSLNDNIKSIKRDPDGLIIEYVDDRDSQPIPFGDAAQDQWVSGVVNFLLPDDEKINDVNSILSRSGLDLSRGLNRSSEGYGEGLAKENEVEAFKRITIDSLGSGLFIQSDEDTTVDNLNRALSKTKGLSDLKASSTNWGVDEVVIKDDKGNEVMRVDLDESFDEQDLLSQLGDLAITGVSDSELKRLTKGKKQTITKSNSKGVGSKY